LAKKSLENDGKIDQDDVASNAKKESPSYLGLIEEVNQEYRVSFQTFL
jgi:hypothetical protein